MLLDIFQWLDGCALKSFYKNNAFQYAIALQLPNHFLQSQPINQILYCRSYNVFAFFKAPYKKESLFSFNSAYSFKLFILKSFGNIRFGNAVFKFNFVSLSILLFFSNFSLTITITSISLCLFGIPD